MMRARTTRSVDVDIDVDAALSRRLDRLPPVERDHEPAAGPARTHGVWNALATTNGKTKRKRKPAPSQDTFWDTLTERVDPTKMRPTLAGDVERQYFPLRWGNDYAMIANPRDVIHFRLEPGEFELLDFMDGTRTVEQIVLDRLHESGDMELSGVVDLVTQLQLGNFLDPPYNDIEEALAMKVLPPPSLGDRFLNFVRTLRVDWTGAEGFVTRLYDHGLKWFYTSAGVALTAAIVVAGVAAFVYLLAGGKQAFSGESAAAESLVILALNVFLIFIHELGHATSLLYYERRIKSAGFLIYFGSPAFFIESSESLMLGRNKRIMQSAVGPYAQAVFAGIGALIALAVPDTLAGRLMFRMAALNYFIVFMNLIPLLELDGYWILSDLIQVPDLRPRSLSFIRHDLFHKIRTRERFSRQELGLAAYGIFGVAFTVFSFYTAALFWEHVFGGLVRSLWNGGTVGRGILAVLGLFVGGPVIRGAISLVRWVARRFAQVAARIRFRLESKWRVEAGELIDALPLFDDVPVDVLNELAGSVQLKHVSRGQPVVRQGERATAFYVVRRGTLHVVEEDRENNNERVIRTLGRGESFGELAVLTSATRRATVRAAEDAEVFEIDKSSFDRLLASMIHVPQFAPTFQDMAELRELPCFQHLEQDELSELLEHGEWTTVDAGATIVKKGAVADTFYAIGSGQVDVLEGRTVMATLGPGSYFGEVGLLRHVRRTATVRARTPVRMYRLDRTGFDRLVRKAFKRGTLDPHIKARRASTH